jgi:hypothetical protein
VNLSQHGYPLLQLADKSIKLSIEIVKDMPIQIDKYFVPINFMIVDMDEDTQIPLLLGKLFLNVIKMVIDVHKGIIFFKIGEENITFYVNRTIKFFK